MPPPEDESAIQHVLRSCKNAMVRFLLALRRVLQGCSRCSTVTAHSHYMYLTHPLLPQPTDEMFWLREDL